MKRLLVLGVLLATAATAAAAPNVTNATQKGSLLVWPDIRIDGLGTWNTLVRIQNDGSLDVDVICYWMDGNKNRVDFIIPVTRNQAVWFDARTGNGTYQVNRFPQTPANGLPNGNPFLGTNDNDPYHKGLLACWAVDNGAQHQVKWNHLSGTATLYDTEVGAYEYNAYAFFVPTGLDLEPVGVAGALNLNGVEYDSCPLYQIGQFTPRYSSNVMTGPAVYWNRLAIAGCHLQLQQDWSPVWTKLQFDVWNEEEVKFTGAYECADSWHETWFSDDIDSASQNFHRDTLGTYAARFRVQGVKSTQCEGEFGPTSFVPDGGIVTESVGVIGVFSARVGLGTQVQDPFAIGTTLAAAGKFTGRIVWDPEGAVPEGGVR